MMVWDVSVFVCIVANINLQAKAIELCDGKKIESNIPKVLGTVKSTSLSISFGFRIHLTFYECLFT